MPRIEELMDLWLEDGRHVGSLIARTTKLLDPIARATTQPSANATLSSRSLSFADQRTRPGAGSCGALQVGHRYGRD